LEAPESGIALSKNVMWVIKVTDNFNVKVDGVDVEVLKHFT
jgi:hypothetical protein